jgi:lambda repressor-like predicted transcriptional regulator
MKTLTPAAAKVELKKRGHSCRSAAKEIGRSYQWINQVLNGHVTSRPVLEAIFDLPVRAKRGAK